MQSANKPRIHICMKQFNANRIPSAIITVSLLVKIAGYARFVVDCSSITKRQTHFVLAKTT